MRLLTFFFCIFFVKLTALINLDKMKQSFILETKKLHIPGYPDAFNPAIVKWNNRTLMSFRSRDRITNQANIVGFTWLDDQFNPIGKPQILKADASIYIQDPRLLVVDKRLFMAYSDLWEDPISKIKKRKMYMTELLYDGIDFISVNPDCYLDFQGDPFNKFEKNWVPFDYQGLVLLAYSLNPHQIFLPLHGENRCVTVAYNDETSSWKWGSLRGGTPALLIEDHYLAFFHSSTLLATVQSEGKSMMHYFMGAYLFENKPPFSIQKISPHPIVEKTFYTGESHQTWKPLRVVFPCGLIHNENYIWVSYGRQDHEAWIVKIDKLGLYKSLVTPH